MGSGGVIAVVAGVELVGALGLSTVTIAAFCGAMGVTWAVYQIARTGTRVAVLTLLLAGFAVSSLASASVSILLLLSTRNWNEIMTWLMGDLSQPDAWTRIRVSLPFVVASLGVVGVFARDLNAMLLGEEQAQQLGVDVERVKKILLAAGTVAAAVAVAMCGIIGFVGLIVPHVVRLLVGPDHRKLLPVTILAGGTFLVGADLVARLVLPPGGLPVGAVTALAGAPFFMLLLRRRSRA